MKPALKLRALQLLFVVSLVVLFCSIYNALSHNNISDYYLSFILFIATAIFVLGIKKEEKRISKYD